MKKSRYMLIALLSMILAVILTTAALAEEHSGVFETVQHINDVYSGIIDTSSFSNMLKSSADESVAHFEFTSQQTLEDAGAALREAMITRNGIIELEFHLGSTIPDEEGLSAWIDNAFAVLSESMFEHQGVSNPKAGDYLRYQCAGYNIDVAYAGDFNDLDVFVTFTIPFYTNAEQEAVVDMRIAELLTQINLENMKDDYEKIRTIYNWVSTNVVYDYDHLNNEPEYQTMRTAFGALIDGTAVCQGYACLLYRLALELGIDARVITGQGNGENHAWNIITPGDGLYYYLDSTWESKYFETTGSWLWYGFDYFLLGANTFELAHTLSEDFLTSTFISNYAISSTEYIVTDSVHGEMLGTGHCGDYSFWSAYSDGLLEISGFGDMYDYQTSSDISTFDSDGNPIENGVHLTWMLQPWWILHEDLSSLEIREGIKTIGGCAFAVSDEVSNDHLSGNLVLPNSLENIHVYAFGESKFTGNLVIPEKVTEIGVMAFYGCKGFTGDLIIPDRVIVISRLSFYGCSGFSGVLAIPPHANIIAHGAFMNCSGFTGGLIIPDSVTYIGGSSFTNCSGFKSLSLGKGVITIWNFAFRDCTGFLGNLELGDSITSIGRCAFYNCYGFSGDLIIGDSVETIASQAFAGCKGFSGHLVIGKSVITIEESAFGGCAGLTGDLIIPDNVTSIGRCSFYECDGFSGNLVIGNGITTIPEYAFSFCRGFAGDLIIGDNVENIERRAFMSCTGFAGKLVIPKSVRTIGEQAFASCVSFSGDLVIPDSVIDIGAHAFDNCIGFDGKLKISNSLTRINEAVFYCCNHLQGDPIIPENVETIGKYAFSWCQSLDGVLKLSNQLSTIEDYAFWFCAGLRGQLILPDSIVTIGECAFDACSGFEGPLLLPNGLINIENGSFSRCGGFSGTLKIPESVSVIGRCAFWMCDGISNCILYGAKIESIGESAFAYCSKLDTVFFSGDCPNECDVSAFSDCAKNFTIYYLEGKEGWTTPTWNEYPCYPIDELPVSEHVVGDINADGEINATDRMILARYLAGWEGYEEKIKSMEAADIDGDGEVTAKDRMILARKLAGWEGYDQYFTISDK